METFEQKVIRNVQGNFAVYKTTEVVGTKSDIPNLEWVESEEVDKFFAFARNLGAKVIYITEGEEEDEQGNSQTNIIQVGFIHQGIMHHINLAEDDEDDDEGEEDEYDYVDEDGEEENSEVLYEKETVETPKTNQEQSEQQHPNQNNDNDFIRPI